MFRLTQNASFSSNLFKFLVIPFFISTTLASFYFNSSYRDIEQISSSYDFDDDIFKTFVMEKLTKIKEGKEKQ